MTFVYGIMVGIFLPDSPVSAKFLSEREKAIAIDRVRVNQTGKSLLPFIFKDIASQLVNHSITAVDCLTDCLGLFRSREQDFQEGAIH